MISRKLGVISIKQINDIAETKSAIHKETTPRTVNRETYAVTVYSTVFSKLEGKFTKLSGKPMVRVFNKLM